MNSENPLDPRDTIAQVTKQEIFNDLLSFIMLVWMLIITDLHRRSKSALLRYMEYNCKWLYQAPVPSYLIDLEDLSKDSEFEFTPNIVQDLNFYVDFLEYSKLNEARITKNFVLFVEISRKCNFNGQISGVTSGTIIGLADRTFYSNELTTVQEYSTREKCIEASKIDLRSICTIKPVAILTDYWEQCGYKLQEWIREKYMVKYPFHPDNNLRPTILVVVITSDPNDCNKNRSGIRIDKLACLFTNRKEYSEVVNVINRLSDWVFNSTPNFL